MFEYNILPKHGFGERIGEQSVHFAGRMVDLIGKQLRDIDAAFTEFFPFGITITNRNIVFQLYILYVFLHILCSKAR